MGATRRRAEAHLDNAADVVDAIFYDNEQHGSEPAIAPRAILPDR